MPRPIFSPGFYAAETQAQSDTLLSLLSSADSTWQQSREKDLGFSTSTVPSSRSVRLSFSLCITPHQRATPLTQSRLFVQSPQRSPPSSPIGLAEQNEYFLDQSSDEALIVKLAGLTRSLTPLGRQLVLELETPLLRRTVRFTEEESIGVEGEKVVKVKAWGRSMVVEGVREARVDESYGGDGWRQEVDEYADDGLAARGRVFAQELGLYFPDNRDWDSGVLEFDATDEEDDRRPTGFDYEVEETHETEEAVEEAQSHAAMLSPSSAVFHSLTLPLGPPPPRRRTPEPPIPTQTNITLTLPRTRTGRMHGNLGPGWAEASRQSRVE
ncbi:hypothetical protein P7C70_g1226, partial [Phenoliferia sp. Uapishka_3]